MAELLLIQRRLAPIEPYMKNILTILFLSLLFLSLEAQDSTATSKFLFSGYIKALETYTSDKLNNTGYANHLIHNRMNLKWRPGSDIFFSAEIRNRIFFGEQIKLIPDFAGSLRNNSEYLNLQKAWVNNNNLVVHTNIERLFVDFKKAKWQLRVGRQRVNWGMATTWNPNDIFNAYNFLDIDFIERPGSDGAKLQYNINDNVNAELVYSVAPNKKRILASKLFVNKWNYDFQFIVGSYMGSYTIGTGWAGNIKNAGFKGEIQYYDQDQVNPGQLNMTIGIDYMFKKGWYANLGGLFNSNGMYEEINNWQSLNLNLSARNLMPGKFSYISTVQKELSPLSSAGMSLVYSPGIQLWIVMPTINYSFSNAIDADIIYQLFYLKISGKLQGISNIGFLRLRYNF
jgi:hypothetical protein